MGLLGIWKGLVKEWRDTHLKRWVSSSLLDISSLTGDLCRPCFSECCCCSYSRGILHHVYFSFAWFMKLALTQWKLCGRTMPWLSSATTALPSWLILAHF